MELIVSLRSQFPQLAVTPAPVSPSVTPPGEMKAVAVPQRVTAVLPGRSAIAAASTQLAESDEDAHPAATARAAAEAARQAYIRASLAAGISPLPLSGV